MTADERLADAFNRAMQYGEGSLSPADHELFLIQLFIIDYEMGGLSGYFYNQLPDSAVILATVEAMSARGLSHLAALLGEAAALFGGYTESDPSSTWDEVRRRYDPSVRLEELHHRIAALDNYGLNEASIV